VPATARCSSSKCRKQAVSYQSSAVSKLWCPISRVRCEKWGFWQRPEMWRVINSEAASGAHRPLTSFRAGSCRDSKPGVACALRRKVCRFRHWIPSPSMRKGPLGAQAALFATELLVRGASVSCSRHPACRREHLVHIPCKPHTGQYQIPSRRTHHRMRGQGSKSACSTRTPTPRFAGDRFHP
jgi:hypothetical protein